MAQALAAERLVQLTREQEAHVRSMDAFVEAQRLAFDAHAAAARDRATLVEIVNARKALQVQLAACEDDLAAERRARVRVEEALAEGRGTQRPPAGRAEPATA